MQRAQQSECRANSGMFAFASNFQRTHGLFGVANMLRSAAVGLSRHVMSASASRLPLELLIKPYLNLITLFLQKHPNLISS